MARKRTRSAHAFAAARRTSRRSKRKPSACRLRFSSDVARTLPRIVNAIAGEYAGLVAPGTGERPLGKSFVDDGKVSDHHAIIPTGVSPGKAALDPDEKKIFDLVCRRLLSA